MKPVTKYFLIALGILALLAPVLYFVAVNAALQYHAKEDGIVFESKRVQEAINDYETCNGKSKTKSANQKAVDFIIQVSTN